MPAHPPTLFGRLPSAVRPATAPLRLHELGAALPPTLRLGTSSWSYPGWHGLLYEREYTERDLARAGLEAYSAHPLLRAVGVDRGWYSPLTEADLRDYAEQVPDDFSFVVKAHADCTQPSSPRLLDAAYATEHVVQPLLAGLGGRAGPLVFQFPPAAPEAFGGAERFAERLNGFLGALPRGPIYAVELRHRALLTQSYAAALRAHGAAHCVNVVPDVPTVATQARVDAAVGSLPLVVRWMQHPAYSYERARDTFTPFHRLQAPLDAARDQLADLLFAAVSAGRPCWVMVGNKAEGCAPRSVARLAEAFARRAAHSS